MEPENDLMDQLSLPEIPIGIYQHYKNGRKYQLIGKALHTETKELLAVYKGQYEPFELFARPWSMFFEQINGVPRFKRIS